MKFFLRTKIFNSPTCFFAAGRAVANSLTRYTLKPNLQALLLAVYFFL